VPASRGHLEALREVSAEPGLTVFPVTLVLVEVALLGAVLVESPLVDPALVEGTLADATAPPEEGLASSPDFLVSASDG